MSIPIITGVLVEASLLRGYDDYVGGLGLGADAAGLRHRQAKAFLAAHPDLGAWMARPLDARLVDLARTKAWPLITWAVLTRRVTADVDLLVSRHLGGMHRAAEAMFPTDFAAIRQSAERLGWGPRWAEHVVVYPLTLAVAWSGRPPAGLADADIDALASAVEASPVVPAARRARHRRDLGRLRQVLFEARIVDRAHQPIRTTARGVAGYLNGVAAPEVRRVMLAYLDARRPVLRPGSLSGVANDLACFGEFLTAQHPELGTLAELGRHHVESFCQWAPHRPHRGSKSRGRKVSASAAAHSVITLRTFLDDIAAWGWAEAPARRLMFAADIPRQPRPLPRALAPDIDAAVMAAVAGIDDRFARTGLTVIRGTGLRAGELVDLELDCVVDYGAGGTWLQVPLGKLATERAVPLDDPTLAALDEWIAERGPQRALPHPRHGRPADFLFVEHGRRLPTARLRRGLAQAVRSAGLTGPGDGPLQVTPHQLRHTYATGLEPSGVALDATLSRSRERWGARTLGEGVAAE
ncbi:MAG: tyrosine-type recombinase/integrase [Acidimicrobiales bacterium]